jgi:hypothetical protein
MPTCRALALSRALERWRLRRRASRGLLLRRLARLGARGRGGRHRGVSDPLVLERLFGERGRFCVGIEGEARSFSSVCWDGRLTGHASSLLPY